MIARTVIACVIKEVFKGRPVSEFVVYKTLKGHNYMVFLPYLIRSHINYTDEFLKI